jgi:hypothetical protein
MSSNIVEEASKLSQLQLVQLARACPGGPPPPGPRRARSPGYTAAAHPRFRPAQYRTLCAVSACLFKQKCYRGLAAVLDGAQRRACVPAPPGAPRPITRAGSVSRAQKWRPHGWAARLASPRALSVTCAQVLELRRQYEQLQLATTAAGGTAQLRSSEPSVSAPVSVARRALTRPLPSQAASSAADSRRLREKWGAFKARAESATTQREEKTASHQSTASTASAASAAAATPAHREEQPELPVSEEERRQGIFCKMCACHCRCRCRWHHHECTRRAQSLPALRARASAQAALARDR